jgi:hypothetical protein
MFVISRRATTTQTTDNSERWCYSWVCLLLTVFLFPIVYGLKPLYYSAQNDKFLRGLAAAGLGYLHEDWVANTPDPFPVFSVLVEWTYNVHAGLFYVYFAVIVGVYAWSLIHIVASTVDFDANGALFILFAICLLTLHSSTLASYELEQGDLRCLFVGGVASKTLFNQYLEPNGFSVFVLLSVAFFLRGHPYAAVVANAVAGTFHVHYLLPAAVITVSYLWLHWRDTQRVQSTIALGVTALATVLPIVVYNATHFVSASPELHTEALQIFNHFRIPHHVELQRWIGGPVVLKIIFIVSALILIRKTRLFIILAPLFTIAVILTLVQHGSGSEELAYILPWRYMVFLVPVATAVLVAVGVRSVINRLSRRAQRLLIMVAATVWVAVLLYPEARRTFSLWKVRTPHVAQDARPMMDHVRQNQASGQLYLIPPQIQTFRIATGVPIFVDWKTVPFGDKEVLEWYRRYRLAESFYAARPEERWTMLATLVQNERITHVVCRTETLGEAEPPSYVVERFRSPVYIVYEVRQRSRSGAQT